MNRKLKAILVACLTFALIGCGSVKLPSVTVDDGKVTVDLPPIPNPANDFLPLIPISDTIYMSIPGQATNSQFWINGQCVVTYSKKIPQLTAQSYFSIEYISFTLNNECPADFNVHFDLYKSNDLNNKVYGVGFNGAKDKPGGNFVYVSGWGKYIVKVNEQVAFMLD